MIPINFIIPLYLFDLFFIPFLKPRRNYAHSYYEVDIVSNYAPEQCNYQSYSGILEHIAVVFGKQPLTYTAAAGVGLNISMAHTTNWRPNTTSWSAEGTKPRNKAFTTR